MTTLQRSVRRRDHGRLDPLLRMARNTAVDSGPDGGCFVSTVGAFRTVHANHRLRSAGAITHRFAWLLPRRGGHRMLHAITQRRRQPRGTGGLEINGASRCHSRHDDVGC